MLSSAPRLSLEVFWCICFRVKFEKSFIAIKCKYFDTLKMFLKRERTELMINITI